MNLNERSTSAATPDLSRLYLISGRIMFDDDDQAYLVEADSPGDAEEAFRHHIADSADDLEKVGNDSNLLIVFYVQIMPDDFVMQFHRF
ncbi:hypothetical protein [Escherichia coli]|uniref:hypothetical protein n=1 Tax=Escherichia coli TaxID=562 RepID=UPI000B571DFC|nr:hypothetical protein [Escherichia coli]ARV52257.1 hypothetical protein BZY74_24760 [Escherichia coli]